MTSSVGDELALLHVGRGLAAELRLLLAVLAQEVARADVGQPEVVLQARRLRALAGAGRTQQDEVELAQVSWRRPGIAALAAIGGRDIYFRKPS